MEPTNMLSGDASVSKKIKVLQLGSPIGLYGAERWIIALARHLNPLKIESWVGSIKDAPNLDVSVCSEAAKYNINTIIMENHGRINCSAVIQLRRFIKEQNINVIHTHGYKTDFIGLLVRIGTKCKIITTPHGWTKKPDFKLRMYELLDRCLFRFFDAVVPLSEELYESLCSIPFLNKNRIHLITNGVDLTEIENENKISDEISQLKAKGTFIIGYIGRLIHGKNLDVLLNVIANHGKPHWRVALIGDGPDLPRLKDMAHSMGLNDKIIFYGYRPDRFSFLKGFDVFVLPSLSEGIPRCLMEAMAAGIPVIASDIPGCRQLIINNKTGLLFKPDQPEQLYEALDRLINKVGFGEKLSMNGKELIYDRFSAGRMAEEYEKLFLKICSS